jgi:hypothetical protein
MSANEDLLILAEDIVDYCNAVEAACVKLKMQIGRNFGPESKKKTKGNAAAPDAPLDVSKLFWEKKQGEKGEYEQTSEKANQNSDLWKTLKVKVKEHKGFWQNGGYKFWFHQQDENVIDRRKV